MASSLNSAKYLKYLSKYGESEIIIGLNSLSTDEQKVLLDISGKLYKSVSQIESVALESKSKVKKLKTISKKDLCKEVMMKIEGRLSDYEGSDKVDKWIMDFEVGLNNIMTLSVLNRLFKSIANFFNRACMWERSSFLCIQNVDAFTTTLNTRISGADSEVNCARVWMSVITQQTGILSFLASQMRTREL